MSQSDPYLINPSGRRVQVRRERLEGLLNQGFTLAPDQSPDRGKPAPNSILGKPIESPPGAPALTPSSGDEENILMAATGPNFGDTEAFPNKRTLVEYGASLGLELDPKTKRPEMQAALTAAWQAHQKKLLAEAD